MTPPQVTISQIMLSLVKRGFLPAHALFDAAAVQEQHNAVIEEIGEVARHLRRAAQRRTPLSPQTLTEEAADVVIAAVALLARCAGHEAEQAIAQKLQADEKRGWLHSGLTRAEYDQGHEGRQP